MENGLQLFNELVHVPHLDYFIEGHFYIGVKRVKQSAKHGFQSVQSRGLLLLALHCY